jgi:hypothetical protein
MTERPGGRAIRRGSEPGRGGRTAARRFRMIRSWLRGYLHEDFAAEHGSPEDAVKAFCRDATPGEIRRLSDEWRELVSLTAEWEIEAISAMLTRDLGGAWAPASKRELSRVTRALAAAGAEPG